MVRAKIVGTGFYVPEKVVTNKDLEKKIDTTDEWITTRTGIKERRIVSNGETTSDLALRASERALKMAGIKSQDLDLIIVTTMSGDMPMPSTASILQYKLGARMVPAMDLNAACTGFLYGLAVAESFIKADSRRYRHVLLVGADIMSHFMDWSDRSTCVIFGDGAGAVVLVPSYDSSGVISTKLYSDGSLWDLVCLPGGGTLYPPSKEMVEKKLSYVKMKGNETFKVAVRTLYNIAKDILSENNLHIDEISLLIPHQANIRIIQAIGERLGLPMEKIFINIDRYGNTSAASIPIALDEALRGGKISKDDYIIMEAFGSGLTWASALIKW
ncbi:MAG: ketoacyl-ACP synthase III [Nitrospirae bacterium]|nr:MAG: ketoacyl-ACP synthase III [Nitrospirota bacterium]